MHAPRSPEFPPENVVFATPQKRLREGFLSLLQSLSILSRPDPTQYIVLRLPLWALIIYVNYIKLLSYHENLWFLTTYTTGGLWLLPAKLSLSHLFLVSSHALQPHCPLSVSPQQGSFPSQSICSCCSLNLRSFLQLFAWLVQSSWP